MSTSKPVPLSGKSFVISALAAAGVLVASYLALCLAIDPFNIVHPAGPARYASNEERLSKRAIALNPAYDSYFAGSSTSRAFQIADFNREFGARFAHLTLSGGTSFEQLNLLRHNSLRENESFQPTLLRMVALALLIFLGLLNLHQYAPFVYVNI